MSYLGKSVQKYWDQLEEEHEEFERLDRELKREAEKHRRESLSNISWKTNAQISGKTNKKIAE